MPHCAMAALPGEINGSVQRLEVLEGIRKAYFFPCMLTMGHCIFGPEERKLHLKCRQLAL